MFALLAAHVIRLHSRKASGAAVLPACIIARASARPRVNRTAARTVASLLRTPRHARTKHGEKDSTKPLNISPSLPQTRQHLRRLFATLPLLAALFPLALHAATPADTAADQAVLAPIQAMFAGMSAHDAAAIRKPTLPRGMVLIAMQTYSDDLRGFRHACR